MKGGVGERKGREISHKLVIDVSPPISLGMVPDKGLPWRFLLAKNRSISVCTKKAGDSYKLVNELSPPSPLERAVNLLLLRLLLRQRKRKMTGCFLGKQRMKIGVYRSFNPVSFAIPVGIDPVN